MAEYQDHPGRYAGHLRRPTVSQRGRPRGAPGGRSAPSGMMNIMTSVMSPFVQCFSPQIDPCTSMNTVGCGNGCADVAVCGSHPSGNHHRYSSANMVTPATAPRHSSTQRSPTMSSYGSSQVAQPPAPPRIVTDVESPSAADVLCGRGGSSNRHNVSFRELVAANKAIYVTLTKKQKMLFSRQVVDTIHQAGGRFLAKDQSTGRWCDIGLQRSLEKASQALREKSTNNNNTSVIISDEGVETTADLEPSSVRHTNPRTVEAPALIVPHHLQPIYGPQPALVSPTFGQEWVADFQPRPHPDPHHPSDRMQSLPPPHMGAFPFSTRQMSRLHNRQLHRARSIPATPSAPLVSPVPHAMSWHQTPYHHPAYSTTTTTTPRPPSPEYPSSAASCNSASTAVTQSAPEFHQYYTDFEPPRTVATHPHPRQDHVPEVKRQRTREEEKREQHEEEEVILVDSDHQTTLNNSLQEGSEQLPREVESKLCLREKVICSPSEMLQGRSGRRRGEQYYHHHSDASMTTSSTYRPAKKMTERLNTSAEAADMAGLAALSTAAYLRLDEGE